MATKREPAKKDDKSKPSKSPEKKPKKSAKKGGGFFSFIFKIVLLIVLVIAGYYGYLFYVEYQKNGGNTDKSLAAIKNKATKDYNNAADNTKKYSSIALDKTTEWSAEAYKNSEEYLKTAKEFTKESFGELSEKIKEIGEKTPAELSSSADNYLKEFMDGKEVDAPQTREEAAYVPKPINHESIDKPAEIGNKETAKSTSTELAKNDKKNNDPVKNDGFVTPEKPIEKAVSQENKKEITKPDESKKSGLTQVGAKIGDKNEGATKKDEIKTLEKPKASDPVAAEAPHMKKYKEGKGYFMQGLEHYKKQMPGQPNENVHRRQAYALFKKAAACFDQVAKNMEGNEEFDRISMDNHRFMFGCGKSMLVDQH